MENSKLLPSKRAGKKLTDITSIRASFRLKDYLFIHGLKGESDEMTIWRLLGLKTLTKEMKEDLKSQYEASL